MHRLCPHRQNADASATVVGIRSGCLPGPEAASRISSAALDRLRDRCSGQINAVWVLLTGAVAVLAAAAALLLMNSPADTTPQPELMVYCAAGIRVPIEQIAAEYEATYGVRIDLQFGGSNTLLSQLRVDELTPVDLYISADAFYAERAREFGLTHDLRPLALQRPVIAVPAGNPRGIRSIDDLLKPDTRVALGNPDQAAIGKATRKRLQTVTRNDGDLWTELEQHVTAHGVFKPTVNDVANDVVVGTVDAGIVWDATIAMPDYRTKLHAVTVPEFDGEKDQVTACVLNSSQQTVAARDFARYLTAPDRGQKAFREFGLEPVPGEAWFEPADRPNAPQAATARQTPVPAEGTQP